MVNLFKWIAAALIAVFLWLIGTYTAEYFDSSPYKKYKLPEFD